MLYVKNLSGLHRGARLLAGAVMASCAFHYGATAVGAIFGVASVFTVLTAVFGYCPMCTVDGGKRRAEKASGRE
jgi:hypothetical protein